MVAHEPLLRVRSAGVCLWLPTIAVAVAEMGTVVEPPKIWMKARARLWLLVYSNS